VVVDGEEEAGRTIQLTGYSGLTDQPDAFDAIVTIPLGGLASVAIAGAFHETGGAETNRFTFSVNTASLIYNIAFPTSELGGSVVFYTGNRGVMPTDPELLLVGTDATNRVYEGAVAGLGDVTVSIGPIAVLDAGTEDSFVGRIRIATTDGSVDLADCTFTETGPDAKRFTAAVWDSDGQMLWGTGTCPGTVTTEAAVIDCQVSPVLGGGNFMPLLVKVEGAGNVSDSLTGIFLDDTTQYQLVPHALEGREALFFGASPPKVFGGLTKDGKVNVDNVKKEIGRVRASLRDTALRLVSERFAVLPRVASLEFKGARDSSTADWSATLPWDDIKLVAPVTATEPDPYRDNRLFLEAKVDFGAGSDAARAKYRSGTTKFKARVLRTNTEIVQMKKDPWGTGPDSEGPTMETTIELDYAGIDVGNALTFRKVIDLTATTSDKAYSDSAFDGDTGDFEFVLGDDDVREVCAVDRFVKPKKQEGDESQNEEGQDGWCLAKGLATADSQYIIRGVAHPSNGVDYDSAVEEKDDAKGGERWGRPVANLEFVQSGGVEKIVVTPYDSRDLAWYLPGFYDDLDYAFVRNPAYVFYGSGDGGRPRPTRVAGLQFTEDGEYYTIGKMTEGWTDELEWMMITSCSVSEFDGKIVGYYGNVAKPQHDSSSTMYWVHDMKPGLQISKRLLGELKAHGVLGFAGNGWTGERWMGKFLKSLKTKSISDAWKETWRTQPDDDYHKEFKPPTFIARTSRITERFATLSDADETTNAISVWGRLDSGYGSVYVKDSREEAFGGAGQLSGYDYVASYDLSNTIPNFPNHFTVNGTATKLDHWRIRNSRKDPPRFAEQTVLSLSKATGSIQWSYSAGMPTDWDGDAIASYQIQIVQEVDDIWFGDNTKPDFSKLFTPSVETATASFSLSSVATWNDGFIYYFRVRAKDVRDQHSNWSPWYIFKVD
jgi:hypothetical protein